MTTYATELEAAMAAATRSAEMHANDEFIEFEGQTCDDSVVNGRLVCAGWDGKYRRCECGTHSVNWSFIKHSKGVWSYYAEAY